MSIMRAIFGRDNRPQALAGEVIAAPEVDLLPGAGLLVPPPVYTLEGNRASRRAQIYPRGVRNGTHAGHTRKRK